MLRRTLLVLALSAPIALGVAACGSSGGSGGGAIDVVAYSTPQEVYLKGLIPAFEKTSAGKGASFHTSFGPSGDQSKAVESGLPADVVEFSLQPDMQRVVDAKLVPTNWDSNSYKGFVTDSVVTFAVRKGNPKGIKDWSDLIKPGVEVLTPNPFQSGGAKWNLMAAYGAQLKQGKTPDQALAYVKSLLGNVPVQDASARDALNTFTSGKGDVLLAYENEAIGAQQAGEKLDYVTPSDTIRIENPIATTTDASKQAKDFEKYLYSDAGQEIFAKSGYRPVVKSVFDKHKSEFPIPSGLFDISYVGGWDKVNKEFFDPTNGKIAGIEQNLGVATSK